VTVQEHESRDNASALQRIQHDEGVLGAKTHSAFDGFVGTYEFILSKPSRKYPTGSPEYVVLLGRNAEVVVIDAFVVPVVRNALLDRDGSPSREDGLLMRNSPARCFITFVGCSKTHDHNPMPIEAKPSGPTAFAASIRSWVDHSYEGPSNQNSRSVPVPSKR
jgi:hypothetical protein